MTAHDLLSQLREKGVEVKTSGDDRLVIDAPKGTITEDLRSALSAHKAELLQILKAEQIGNGSSVAVSEAPEPPKLASTAPEIKSPAPELAEAALEAPVEHATVTRSTAEEITEASYRLPVGAEWLSSSKPHAL